MRLVYENLLTASDFVSGTNWNATEDSITDTSNALDQDFSNSMTIGKATGTVNYVELKFATVEANCICLAGNNFNAKSISKVELVRFTATGSEVVATADTLYDNTIFLHSPSRAEVMTHLAVRIYGPNTSWTGVSISYLLMGRSFEVPNDGENAGYMRPWSVSAKKQKVQKNNGTPTVAITENMPIKVTLNIKNITTEFVKSTWMQFQMGVVGSGFFVLEETDEPENAYFAFDAVVTPVTAHAQTRKLQNAKITFQAWTGR